MKRPVRIAASAAVTCALATGGGFALASSSHTPHATAQQQPAAARAPVTSSPVPHSVDTAVLRARADAQAGRPQVEALRSALAQRRAALLTAQLRAATLARTTAAARVATGATAFSYPGSSAITYPPVTATPVTPTAAAPPLPVSSPVSSPPKVHGSTGASGAGGKGAPGSGGDDGSSDQSGGDDGARVSGDALGRAKAPGGAQVVAHGRTRTGHV